MLKKARGFELTELLAIVTIIVILAALIAPNVIIGIQKSKQKNTSKDTTDIISTNVIEKIKTSHKSFNKYLQGIMGVNKAERELAEATEIYKKHYPDLWLIKPWERNDSNFNNSGRKEKAGTQEVLNVKKN